MFNISFLITTIGRPTLKNTLNSLIPQLIEGDLIYVICDGKQYEKNTLIILNKLHNKQIKFICNKNNEGYFGHGSRNKYQKSLTGDFIHHGDDDDIYLPNSISKIRKELNKDEVLITKFYSEYLKLIEGNLTIGSIGTPSGFIPNIPELMGEWKYQYNGDYYFYKETLNNFKKIKHSDIKVYSVKPHIYGIPNY